MFRLLGIWEMKTEDACVTAVSESGIIVAVDPSCRKTRSCRECGMCGVSESVIKVFIPLADPYDYKAGMRVRVKRFAANEAVAASVLFGIPLACAAFTAVWLQIRFPALADSPKGFGIVAASLLFGFGPAALIDRILRANFPPMVIK